LAFGDVAAGREDVRLAVDAEDLDADLDGDESAVAGLVVPLGGGLAALEQFTEAGAELFGRSRADVVGGQAEEFLAGVAESSAGLVVDLDEAAGLAVGVDGVDEHGVASGVEERLVSLLAFAQRGLDAGAF